MIIVIQCAASKQPCAGHLRRRDGQKVMFVANPDCAPADDEFFYARPDDLNEEGVPWRNVLLVYNKEPRSNSLNLLPSCELYKHPAYMGLVKKFGQENVYILSAGWGLIAANFLTPAYDITFSPSAETFKRRRKADRYNDFSMLPDNTSQPVVFLGGKDYVQLFCTLTSHVKARRVIVHKTEKPPDAPGCTLKQYHTNKNITWYYSYARALIEGSASLD